LGVNLDPKFSPIGFPESVDPDILKS
jgi:hypothetical protein